MTGLSSIGFADQRIQCVEGGSDGVRRLDSFEASLRFKNYRSARIGYIIHSDGRIRNFHACGTVVLAKGRERKPTRHVLPNCCTNCLCMLSNMSGAYCAGVGKHSAKAL
jgi:hypothetical protein